MRDRKGAFLGIRSVLKAAFGTNEEKRLVSKNAANVDESPECSKDTTPYQDAEIAIARMREEADKVEVAGGAMQRHILNVEEALKAIAEDL